MTDLDALILFWQTIIIAWENTMSPSMVSGVQKTIKALEELKQLKEEKL